MADFDITHLLRSLGIRAETFDRLKLGRGVIGKTTNAWIALCVPLALMAWGLSSRPEYLIIFAVIVLLLFAAYFFGSLWFANKNPAQALLEGSELITWKSMEMAAKDMPKVPLTPAIPDPQNPIELLPPETADGS